MNTDEPKHRVRLHQKHGTSAVFPAEAVLTLDGKPLEFVEYSIQHGRDAVARVTITLDCIFETGLGAKTLDAPADPSKAEARG